MLGGIAAGLVSGPIPQPQAYHDFADRRGAFGVPNALDVLSNAPFLLVGLLGIAAAIRSRGVPVPPASWERLGFLLVSVGVAVVALGSAYYHLDPRDQTLVWDRLPMAMAFSAFFALLLGERVSPRLGCIVLLPLFLLGVVSVLHWWWTLSLAPGGDLRAYLVVKFVPLVATILLLLLVPDPKSTRAPLWAAIAAFTLATVLELLDPEVFRVTGHVVSGHTLKHLAAALACFFLLVWFRRRGAAADRA